MSKVIKSGEVVIGRCGVEAGEDTFGRELFVGDIVQIYHVENSNADWSSVSMTVIAECDSMNNLGVKPFAFGIMNTKPLEAWEIDCDHPDFTGDEDAPLSGWVVSKVKDHSECVIGEHWKSFGFNYAEAENDN